MNNKRNNSNFEKIKEFRFHSVSIKTNKGSIKLKKHPTYLFLKNGDIVLYVPLTHSKKIKGKIVIKLRKNPNPKDINDSYYIAEIYEDVINNFTKQRKAWSIDEKDDEDIRRINKKPLRAD